MQAQPSFVATASCPAAIDRLNPVGPSAGTKVCPDRCSTRLNASSVSVIGTSTSCPSPVARWWITAASVE